MFHMYDKIFISVTSHALEPLPCHKMSHLMEPLPPLERDVLYGRLLMPIYGIHPCSRTTFHIFEKRL